MTKLSPIWVVVCGVVLMAVVSQCFLEVTLEKDFSWLTGGVKKCDRDSDCGHYCVGLAPTLYCHHYVAQCDQHRCDCVCNW